MSVITMPASYATEPDLEEVIQLAVTLSKRLTRAHHDGIGSAISEALTLVAAATHSDSCALIEFNTAGKVARVHGSVVPLAPGAPAERWLVDRLAAGDVVAISRVEDLPAEATTAREWARRVGGCSILAVPSADSGQVGCALVLDGSGAAMRWPQPLIVRIQLLAELFDATVRRCRDEESLRSNVAEIERLNSRLDADTVYLKEEIKNIHDFDDIVGESAALRLALTRLSQVAPTQSTVLLQGPTGTGKELFARALHERSRRHARPLVRVNCAALPPTLVESELFGHEKGAFTGAVGMRQGRFELADGGTIFLDEIGDLAPEIQVKFLRVLQEGEFERVGASRTRKVDVRVIAATHIDLEAAVASGKFRADLYYRLSVYPIQLPSLKERFEDIPRLVWFFIHRHQRELGRQITKVPQAVMDALQHHSWPGNIRELENVIERAMIASTGDTLRLDEPVLGRRTEVRAAVTDNLDSVQRAHIEAVLRRCNGRINGTNNAAARLGMHPNTLRFRMKKLGVTFSEGRGRPQADTPSN